MEPVTEVPKTTKRKTFVQPPPGSGRSSRRQLMEKKGWSSTFLWNAMRKHGLPFRKLGKMLIFIDAEVDQWEDAWPGQRLVKR